jgi:Rrf2 family protein
MRITQWAEYGIHCATYIGQRHKEGSAAVPAADIAAAQNIPIDYTQQILQRLRKNGIVKSIRGPLGGYALASPPENITLEQIIAASEGATFEVICEAKPLDHDRCAEAAQCGLRSIWYSLRDHVNEFLSRYTLKDIIERSTELPKPSDKPIQINPHS